MAFTEEMIDVLRDEGYDWVIVAAHHFSRTCLTYLTHQGADPETNYQINSSEPNRADLNGPSPTDGWWYESPNPGNAAWNVAPFAYQLHTIQYVNPQTGEVKRMVAVPSDDMLSYQAGYSGATMNYAEHIAYGADDSDHPVVVLPATDGDNAWGGGASSWQESWPSFTHQAREKGWDNGPFRGLSISMETRQPLPMWRMVPGYAPKCAMALHIFSNGWNRLIVLAISMPAIPIRRLTS